MDQPLLPQRPTDERAEVASVEWLFGPAWPGDRLIARVSAQRVILTAVDGRLATLPAVERLVQRAVTASSAIVDGVWTDHGIGEGRSAFVGLDLLALGDEWLLDVPFQERRRLLESVTEQGPLVRIGPLVKQPVGGWLAGWRAAGFSHYFAWHQNARYLPGEQSDDWLRIPIEAPPSPGLLRRVVGGRGPRIRRIR